MRRWLRSKPSPPGSPLPGAAHARPVATSHACQADWEAAIALPAVHAQHRIAMQVGEAVGQMDRATQQNAALVEESAAAAESLKDQASRLAGVVRVFRLAGSAHA